MWWIFLLIIAHWYVSLYFQTVFLHRYGAHNMFKLHPVMEKLMYLGTFLTQGSSFLTPRAYAVLHKLHHKHSDDSLDPHSPQHAKTVWEMMFKTLKIYKDIQNNPEKYEYMKVAIKDWGLIEKLAASWIIRALFAVAFLGIYYVLAGDSYWLYALLPLHFMMGPIHGAIVNWCGHKYGYQNFDNSDHSRNTLPIDFLMMGELYQNNHHKFPTRAKFAFRKFEIDFGYVTVWVMKKFKLAY